MDKTFAVIEKLKEVELELHRLKNYAEMMNRAVEAKREWQGLTDEDIEALGKTWGGWAPSYIKDIEAKLKEKNA